MDGPLILRRWVNDNTAGLLYKDDPRLMIVRLEDFSQRPREIIPMILAHVGLPLTWKKSSQLLIDAAIDAAKAQRAHEAKGLYHAAAKARELGEFDLLDHLISPGGPGGANATFERTHRPSKSGSSRWPFGMDNNSGLKEHDRLRRYQISQPLNPVVAKWPKKMTEEDKGIFKGDPQAMKLLEYFKYDQGDDW